ncbi:MAG: glycosyltransferase, partial [Chitinophagaceae bacterium]
MKDEKTLVILTPGFAKDEADSTCLPMQQQLLRALKESDPKLNIIILSFQYPYHTKKYDWFDITVIPFNGRNKGGLPRLLLRKKISATLKKIHSSTPITGLLSFWYGECAAVGKQFADTYAIKHFCWLLGQDAKKDNKYPKQIRLGSTELIALSDFLQTEFEKNHGIKPHYIIPPGLNTGLFSAGTKEKDIDIIGVGSLLPLKQYDIFVDVIAEIKKQIPGIKVLLTGDGPEKQKLQTLIEDRGLNSNVTLTGSLPHLGVLQLMERTKVFLHTSSYEGFGVVALEALYAGCHVISFNRPMNEEIENWHIVPSPEKML